MRKLAAFGLAATLLGGRLRQLRRAPASSMYDVQLIQTSVAAHTWTLTLVHVDPTVRRLSYFDGLTLFASSGATLTDPSANSSSGAGALVQRPLGLMLFRDLPDLGYRSRCESAADLSRWVAFSFTSSNSVSRGWGPIVYSDGDWATITCSKSREVPLTASSTTARCRSRSA